MRWQSIAPILACIVLLSACEEPAPVVSSTLITNAVIHNGSGGEAFDAAVRIDGDRIIEIGNFEPLEGETVIDAGGLVLAPGFIDTHSHHDEHLDEYRHMPGALSQGITTITRGMDGFSDISNQVHFIPLADFKRSFAAAPAAVNIASFSPHNSIRRQVLGVDNERIASDEEIEQMSELIAADMAAGALGLATGLEYEPGLYSSTEEVIALSKVVADFDGRYTSHVRDEDDRFIGAVQEVIRIGREAGLPVHIAHIKLADREYWGTSSVVLELLDDAISKGVQVTADIYPYQRWASNPPILFPDRGNGGGHPRGYGAFPRVLGHFVRELGVLTLQDAIHKMTGLPAKTLGIEQRGRIRTGYYADLVLFDPDTIQDKATMQDSTALSVGIEKVWVNGVLAFDQGKPTMAYAGQIITR
jgi:N-acyl-D-amino-acid deacylase